MRKSLFVKTMQTRERLMKHPTCWKPALFALFAAAVVSVPRDPGSYDEFLSLWTLKTRLTKAAEQNGLPLEARLCEDASAAGMSNS